MEMEMKMVMGMGLGLVMGMGMYELWRWISNLIVVASHTRHKYSGAVQLHDNEW